MCCSFYVYMTLVYGSALGLGKLRRFYIVKRGYIRDPGSRLCLSWRPHVLQATSPCGQRVNHSNTRGLVSSLFFSRSRKITAALSLHFQHLLWRLKAKRFKTYSKEEALYTVYAESIDRSSRKVMIKECKSWKYLYCFFYNQFSIRLCLHPCQSPHGSLPASTPPGSTENLFPLSSGARPGGWPPSTGQNPHQGRLRHLQLLPDGSQRNPSTSELHCNPFWISFEVFSLSVSAERP